VIWQIAQDDGTEHAEDRRIGADAKRQREDRYRCVARVLAERTQAVLKVADKAIHRVS
jgi:hypothetical protein